MEAAIPSKPLSLAQFRRDAAAIPGTVIRVTPIPDLLSRFMRRPLESGYETLRAVPFGPEDFTLPFLDEAELDRLNTFKVMKKQVEWACGRFAVKTQAKEILLPDNALTDIRILYRSQGAPYLEGLEDRCLSLSHSGGMTAAALSLSAGQILGIDIEAVGPMPDRGFMTTAFTAREIEIMSPCPEDLFRCWTLKEAYLKFIQKGFNESLHRVEILGNRIFHCGKEQPVVCRSWLLEEGYSLSLITGDRPEPPGSSGQSLS